ncbi:ATPase [Pedobacter yulinensis]|uniref:ATPase n=1 Tax=Pedobacter yulinensis TaxID=2126353 RepID=A0A2T3HLM0_9SPHI|nr:SRPBCC domain-containing protein [Pedobacter yulinensis]PST83358.1 ATPase [Pedobacter yulinensis]
MNTINSFQFRTDKEKRMIYVEKHFDASGPLVWRTWTEPDLLDKWWAPKPWKARTREMKFEKNGFWHYAMVGPEGECHWAIFNYNSIEPERGFSGSSAFTDEQRSSTDGPVSFWSTVFDSSAGRTRVKIDIAFEELAALETMIGMGFREGFESGLQNLDMLLPGLS